MASRLNTKKLSKVVLGMFFSVASLAGFSSAAQATPRDLAYKLFNRLNGVPPTPEVLDAMTSKVAAGDLKGAAMDAINDSKGMFYNLTLKNMVARWSNTDKTPRQGLNDYIATVIGMVRDDIPFDQVLAGDILYTGNVTGAPAYSLANNDHYTFLETNGADLHTVLTKQTQSAINGLPAAAVAGVMTSRGFAEAYIKDGTNRRAIAFTLANYTCNELEQLMDTTRPDVRVRQDVPRAPGNDTAMFRNKCAGCHAGMDAFGGAFAYYDWNPTTNALTYTQGVVAAKMNRNAHEFPDGYRTTDDSWINMWLQGQNAALGWNGDASGNGAASWGKAITASDAFASCMAKKSFATVCLRAPSSPEEMEQVKDLAAAFKGSTYNMKQLFADTAATCVTE